MFKSEAVSKITYIFHFRIAEGSWFSWVILIINLVVDIRKQNFAKDREPSEARHKLTTHKALRLMKYMILQHLYNSNYIHYSKSFVCYSLPHKKQ